MLVLNVETNVTNALFKPSHKDAVSVVLVWNVAYRDTRMANSSKFFWRLGSELYGIHYYRISRTHITLRAETDESHKSRMGMWVMLK